MAPGSVPDAGQRLQAEAAALLDAACARVDDRAALVVDAGCGARRHLDVPPTARIVGIDLSPGQLRRNHGTRWLVQGDAARLPVTSAVADGAISWDVLEHLPRPEEALAELARVVRPGGVIVVGIPNVLSLKGLVTRLTPWWVHVWVYRRLLGDATAGTDHSDQFPTTLRLVLRAAGLRRLAATLGLDVELLSAYEGPVPRHFRRRYRAGDWALRVLGAVSRGISLGRYDATASDLIVVFRRQECA